jgi:hypothetical protein
MSRPHQAGSRDNRQILSFVRREIIFNEVNDPRILIEDLVRNDQFKFFILK